MSPSKPRKLFTPAEATRTLPLVKRIVADINAAGQVLRELAAKGAEDTPEFGERLGEMERLMKELEDLGCYYKDWNFSVGLVDFPSEIDGKPVLLCWKSDEPEIQFYHSYEEGFSGRKPIPKEAFATESS